MIIWSVLSISIYLPFDSLLLCFFLFLVFFSWHEKTSISQVTGSSPNSPRGRYRQATISSSLLPTSSPSLQQNRLLRPAGDKDPGQDIAPKSLPIPSTPHFPRQTSQQSSLPAINCTPERLFHRFRSRQFAPPRPIAAYRSTAPPEWPLRKPSYITAISLILCAAEPLPSRQP